MNIYMFFLCFIKVEDCALQIYRQNGTEAEYGPYLDLDQSLDEQPDEFDQIRDNKKTIVLLRTQLSVRVHTCIGKFLISSPHFMLQSSFNISEKILNSKDSELRRSLFLLKQLFQVIPLRSIYLI